MNGRKRKLRLTNAQKQKKYPELSQYAAILVFIGLTVLLCVSVRYGLQNDDETTCVVGAHRMMLGELPLLENWTLVQLHSFVEYLPFRICYALLGGTEGIYLALRYVYVAVKMLFFAVICISFRKYRYWAILAALIFTAFHPLDFLSLTYYNTSILCAFAVGWLLFIKEKRSAPVWIIAGVLSALCILSEPPVILLYLLFTITAAVSFFITRSGKAGESRAARLPDLKNWGLFTAGAALVACVVFAVVLSKADLKTFLANATGVLRILEFHPQTNQWRKFSLYFFETGTASNAAACLLLLLLSALAAAKRLRKYRTPLFAAACLVFIWLTAEMFLRTGLMRSAIYITAFKPVPLCFLGLISFLLAEKKNKKLFAFFLFGIAFSVCMDLFSRITICAGGIVSVPAAVLLFRQTLLECREEIRGKKMPEKGKQRISAGLRRVLYGSAAVICVLVLTASECAYCFYARWYPSPEAMVRVKLSEQIEYGPLKGLYTIPDLKEKYAGVMADMDRIRAHSAKSLFIMDYVLWGNLYLELPYATFSPDSYDTPESRDCLQVYWALHPDKRPDAVYIPFFGCDDYLDHTDLANDNLSYMQSICECSIETGDAGYILLITKWL